MILVTAHATRRRILAGSVGGAALLAACGTQPAPATREGAPAPAFTGPKEMTWSCYQLGEARQKLWDDTWKAAEQATGIKVNVLWEPGQGYWDKRQAEAAAGSGTVDIMVNQLNWVVSGGLTGLFVDHNDYMRRDKVNPSQYYKADLESWSWKGKLWSMPMQSGGEVVLFNKALFDTKGVKYPTKDWTYDDLLQMARQLNDPDNKKYALQIGQNGIHYMMGTFIYNFGGRILNEAKDRALYGDDGAAIRGAELDVDLHVKHRFTPPADVLATIPQGKSPMELGMVAMEFNGLFRHTNVRAAIGAENLDFAPPPKGPSGIQRAAVGGNGWSILAHSKAKDASWAVLKWLHTPGGMAGPQLDAVSWPPVIAAANSAKWLELFRGTRITDAAKVWETGGHDLVIVPEGDKAWSTMNGPITQALRGEMGTRDAMQESARQLQELFNQRPAAWK